MFCQTYLLLRKRIGKRFFFLFKKSLQILSYISITCNVSWYNLIIFIQQDNYALLYHLPNVNFIQHFKIGNNLKLFLINNVRKLTQNGIFK